MIIIPAIVDNQGRVTFPQDVEKPMVYFSCHADNINFYFFETEQERDQFWIDNNLGG